MGATGISGDEGGIALISGGVPSSLLSFTRASTATYTNSSGVIASAATNEARTCYDGYGALLGLVVEEQRTNLALRSQEFDNASWTKSGVSISANAATAPDGTSTADKVVEDSSVGAYHAAYQVVAGGVETSAFSFSVFVKAAERTSALLMVGNARATYSIINLSTGSFSLPSGPESANLTVSTEPFPNGWWRVHIKGTFGVADSPYAWVGASDGNSTYTGDGASGIYVWGAQWEAGAFPTSYIPTTTATVTRSADSLTLTNLSSIGFSATAGSMAVKARPMTSGQTFDVVGFNDNTINEAVYVYSSTGVTAVMAIRDGGVTQASVAPATSSNAPFKFACAWALNDFAASANGSAVQTDVSGTLGTVDRLEMGAALNGFSGGVTAFYIETLRYWSVRQQDAELVRQSTWSDADVGSYVSIVSNGVLSTDVTFSRSSSKWFVGSNGLIQSASNNVAALEYSASGTLLGFLAEEQKTNYIFPSEDFSTLWANTNSTESTDGTIAPDGGADAYKILADNAGTVQVYVTRSLPTLPGAGSYTASVYCKPGNITVLRLTTTAYDAGGNGDSYFTLSGSGSVLSKHANHSAARITACANGWYRCSVVFASTTDLDGIVRLAMATSAATTIATTGAEYFYLWGAQMEAGDMATSYIPTVGATVTRSADAATMTLPQVRWNHSGGTTLVEASRPVAYTAISGATLTMVANNPGISVYKAADFAGGVMNTLLYVNSSPDLGTNMGGVSDNAVYRVAASWALNSLVTSANGAAVATDSSGGLPNATGVAIGYWTGFGGAHYLNGHVKNARYWRTWVPATNVQRLST